MSASDVSGNISRAEEANLAQAENWFYHPNLQKVFVLSVLQAIVWIDKPVFRKIGELKSGDS